MKVSVNFINSKKCHVEAESVFEFSRLSSNVKISIKILQAVEHYDKIELFENISFFVDTKFIKGSKKRCQQET